MRYPFLNSDPTAEVTVTVTDGTNPIEDAVVTFTDHDDVGVTFSGETDASGEVVIEVPLEKYDITATATGYVDYEHSDPVVVGGDYSLSIAMDSLSGNVTVTAIDSEELAVEDATVLLTTETITLDSEPSTDIIMGGGITGADGTITLKTFNENHQWTDVDADIPFGTYYLSGFATIDENIIASLNGTFVVDSETETVTITLTEINNG